MGVKKIFLQCGYEDECKKECLNCKKNSLKLTLNLNQAEQCVIEDFAVCDLQSMIDTKPEVLELTQNIMKKIMYKMFREERKNENRNNRKR